MDWREEISKAVNELRAYSDDPGWRLVKESLAFFNYTIPRVGTYKTQV